VITWGICESCAKIAKALPKEVSISEYELHLEKMKAPYGNKENINET